MLTMSFLQLLKTIFNLATQFAEMKALSQEMILIPLVTQERTLVQTLVQMLVETLAQTRVLLMTCCAHASQRTVLHQNGLLMVDTLSFSKLMAKIMNMLQITVQQLARHGTKVLNQSAMERMLQLSAELNGVMFPKTVLLLIYSLQAISMATS